MFNNQKGEKKPPQHHLTKRFPGKDRQGRRCWAGEEKSVISKREGDSHRIRGEVPQQKVKINGTELCPERASSFWRNLRKSFQANRNEVYLHEEEIDSSSKCASPQHLLSSPPKRELPLSQPHGSEDNRGEICRDAQRPFHQQIQKSKFVAEFTTELSGCRRWAPFSYN